MVTIISDFNLNVQLIFSNFIFDFPKLITEKKEGAKTAPVGTTRVVHELSEPPD